MPIRADDPLRKITFNIYEEDYQWLIKNYGQGWTERLRQHIHNEGIKRENSATVLPKSHRRTLGDLLHE